MLSDVILMKYNSPVDKINYLEDAWVAGAV